MQKCAATGSRIDYNNLQTPTLKVATVIRQLKNGTQTSVVDCTVEFNNRRSQKCTTIDDKICLRQLYNLTIADMTKIHYVLRRYMPSTINYGEYDSDI